MAKLATKDKIRALLSSNVSAYQIAQHTKVSESAVSKLRHGESHIGNLSLDAGLSLAEYYDGFDHKPMNVWDELIGTTLAKMSIVLVQYEADTRGINKEYIHLQDQEAETPEMVTPGSRDHVNHRLDTATGYQRKLDSYYSFLESINDVMALHRFRCSVQLSSVIHRLKVLTDGSIDRQQLDKDIKYLSDVAKKLIPKKADQYDIPYLIKTLAFDKKKAINFIHNGVRSF